MTGASYILLIEDNPGDARLVGAMFEDAPPGSLPGLCWEQTVSAGAGLLARQPGCVGVLLDLGLPDSQGLQALKTIRDHAGETPIIVLSGNADDAVGIAAVVAGAQDYLIKGTFDGAQLRRAWQYATQRKRFERELLAQAMHDQLTGLPTRALLLDRLRVALSGSARNATQGALLFVDLDRFKQINDDHGHAAGDVVLKAVAVRMLRAVRGNDTVARIGGDEFIVLLPVIAHNADSETVARKLLRMLCEPVRVGGFEVTVSASIGTVEFCDQSDTAEGLIARADQAMYLAKRDGRSTMRAALDGPGGGANDDAPGLAAGGVA